MMKCNICWCVLRHARVLACEQFMLHSTNPDIQQIQWFAVTMLYGYIIKDSGGYLGPSET